MDQEVRMQKIRNYKKFGMGVACLLTAGTVAFSNIGIVTAAEPQDSNTQTVAEKTEPEKAPKGIFGNGTSGIQINIHGDIYKKYAKKSYGSYAYGPEGCAWFASARASEITGNDTPIFDGMNWYDTWYKNYGYTRGQKLHAKALVCYTGHVAVVEKIDGDKITISEGGWGPSGKDYGYTIIQTLSQKELESNRGGTGDFVGYVYLDGAQLGEDEKPSNPEGDHSGNNDSGNNENNNGNNENQSGGSGGNDDQNSNQGNGGNLTDGWHNDGISWQYIQNGQPLTSQWISDGGKWYYVGSNTYMKSQTWLKLGEQWYYLTFDGSMAIGWMELHGTWFYLYEDGSMATDWVQLGSDWYYLYENGSMATGWLKHGNDWYYMYENGAMASNVSVDGFYLGTDGRWKTGETWNVNATGWWYTYSDGSYPIGCWRMIDNEWYHFDAQGYMETGWIQDGTAWYYLKQSGAMAKNCWVSNYYVGENGIMYTNSRTPDGYYVGADGLWIPEE